jgi:hypothetical protein
MLAAAATAAADALVTSWPEVDRDPWLAEVLRANTSALRAAAGDALWTDSCHDVLYRAGHSLDDAGRHTAAAAYFDGMASEAARRYGEDHQDVLMSRVNQADSRGLAGDTVTAANAYEELLPALTRSLGVDHPATIVSRQHYGHWRRQHADSTIDQTLLADMLRVLGPDHPQTLIVRGNLAEWLGQLGDAAGAAAAYGALLSDMVRALGPDDRSTLTTRANMARWQGLAGDAAGAVAAFEKLLPDMIRVLSPTDTEVLVAQGYLAHWRGQAGDRAGSQAATVTMLVHALNMLGVEDPDMVREAFAQLGEVGPVEQAAVDALLQEMRATAPQAGDSQQSLG